jgi:hypothetical protein
MVYKDVAPRRLEVTEMERTGLSYRDRDFDRPCTHHWETIPCLWTSWWEDHNWTWIDKLINLEEVCYRPSRSMLPVSVDRPLAGHSLSSSISSRTETNVSLPKIQMSHRQLYRSVEGNIVVPPSNLAKSFLLRYTCAKAQIKHSMIIFYALTKYIGDCRREQLQEVTINFNTLGFIGRPTERMQFPHITTLEYMFNSGDISTAHVNSSLDLTLVCNGHAMPGTGLCPNIRHLIVSGKSLAGHNALHMSAPQIGLISGFSQLLCPIWAPTLETLSLANVKLDLASVQKLLGKRMKLRLKNVVVFEDTMDVFSGSSTRNLRSIDVSGLIVIVDKAVGGYDKVWVVGDEVQAAATVREYRQYVIDPLFLEIIPYVSPDAFAQYMLSGGSSPLRPDNIWTTSKNLRLGNNYDDLHPIDEIKSQPRL